MSPRARSKSSFDRERLRAVATPVARVVSGVIVLGCLGAAADHLAAVAKEHPRFSVDPVAVADEAMPDWVPAPIADEMRSRLASIEPIPIFDGDFSGRLRTAVATSCAWVEAVPRVERVFPNRALLEIELRRPTVAVDHAGRRYLIDDHGRVLHEESSLRPTGFPFPVWVVGGARSSRTPQVGQPFPDAEVDLAVMTARELGGLPESWRGVLEAADIVGIEVRGEEQLAEIHPGEVLLRSAASRAVIRWGRPAGYRNADGDAVGLLERPVGQKVTHLRQVLERYPRLVGLDLVRLDLDQPMFRVQGGEIEYLASAYLEAPLESSRDLSESSSDS